MLSNRSKLEKYKKRVVLRLSGKKGLAVPVFIFGKQRSGTNMLFDVLNRSTDVEGYREADEEAYKDYMLRDRNAISGIIKKSYAKIVLFKPISDSQSAREILDQHENSKAIWIYRHYNAVIMSALRKWKDHNNYLYYILHDQKKAKWRAEKISEKNRILVEKYYNKGISEESARALIWYLRNCCYFLNQLDTDDRAIITKYEDLVTEKALFREIFHFLNLSYNETWNEPVFSTSANREISLNIDPEIQELCDGLYRQLERSRFGHRAAGIPNPNP